MEDFEWNRTLLLFAVILISAIKWGIDKFKEKNQDHYGKEEDEEEEYHWEREPEHPSPTPPPPPVTASPRSELKRFFEALDRETGKETNRPEPPPLPPGYPPPEQQPSATRTASTSKAPSPGTVLSDAEKNALENIRLGKIGGRKTRHSKTRIQHLLKSPGSIRQAVILKEVLDTPKALRPEA